MFLDCLPLSSSCSFNKNITRECHKLPYPVTDKNIVDTHQKDIFLFSALQTHPILGAPLLIANGVKAFKKSIFSTPVAIQPDHFQSHTQIVPYPDL